MQEKSISLLFLCHFFRKPSLNFYMVLNSSVVSTSCVVSKNYRFLESDRTQCCGEFQKFMGFQNFGCKRKFRTRCLHGKKFDIVKLFQRERERKENNMSNRGRITRECERLNRKRNTGVMINGIMPMLIILFAIGYVLKTV